MSKWELYEWCGKCRYKYRFIGNLQCVIQCFSNVPSQGQLPIAATRPAHGRRINAASLDSSGCFQWQKLQNNYPLPFYFIFFKQISIRFNNFLIFIGVWSSLCNIGLISLGVLTFLIVIFQMYKQQSSQFVMVIISLICVHFPWRCSSVQLF